MSLYASFLYADILANSFIKVNSFISNTPNCENWIKTSPIVKYADVFGEHGNSQVSIWSTVTINGHLISDSNNSNRYSLSDDDKMAINHATKYGADIVLAGKQATCFGIAGALTSICKAIKYDAMLPMNISCFHENCFGGHDVFLSTPTIIGKEGIARMLPYSLSQQESEQLELSANIISQATEKIISLIS